MPTRPAAALPPLELNLRFEPCASGPGLRVRLEAFGQVALGAGPLDERSWEGRLADYRAVMARGPRAAGDPLAAQQIMTQRMGAQLARALFTHPVRALVAQAYGQRTTRALRLHLHFVPEDTHQRALLALPWETLYDEDLGGFLDDWLAIVRRVPAQGAPKAALVPGDPPLRVLALLGNPVATQALDLAGERRALTRAGHDLVARRLDLRYVQAPTTLEALEHALDASPARVFHFGGHGSDAGALLALTTRRGDTQHVSGEALAARLVAHDVALAVLNACDTLAATAALQPILALLAGGLSAVVAMQWAVGDTAAVAFTEEFYRQLAVGSDLTDATWKARRRWRKVDVAYADWTAPVLVLAHEDGRLLRPLERTLWARTGALVALLTYELALVLYTLERLTSPGWRGAPWANVGLPTMFFALLLGTWRFRGRGLRALGLGVALRRLTVALWAAACAAAAALLARGIANL